MKEAGWWWGEVGVLRGPEKEPLEEMNTWGSVTSGAWTRRGGGKSLESSGDTNLREITIPREVEAGKLRKSRINVHGHICSGVGSAAIQVVLPVKNKVKWEVG